MNGDAPMSIVALMLVRGGVAFEDSADAARCYPVLWPNPTAARQAFHRARRVTGAGGPPSEVRDSRLQQATYQARGAGKRLATLLFDPTMVPPDVLRAWLEARIGALARFALELPSADAPQAAASPSQSQEHEGNAPEKAPAASGGGDQQIKPDGLAPAEVEPAGSEPIDLAPAPTVLSVEEQQVALLQKRLQLAGLAGRLRVAKPKRTLAIRALDWAELEDAARQAAELPSAEWAAWRGGGDEGAAAPQPTGSAVADALR